MKIGSDKLVVLTPYNTSSIDLRRFKRVLNVGATVMVRREHSNDALLDYYALATEESLGLDRLLLNLRCIFPSSLLDSESLSLTNFSDCAFKDKFESLKSEVLLVNDNRLNNQINWSRALTDMRFSLPAYLTSKILGSKDFHRCVSSMSWWKQVRMCAVRSISELTLALQLFCSNCRIIISPIYDPISCNKSPSILPSDIKEYLRKLIFSDLGRVTLMGGITPNKLANWAKFPDLNFAVAGYFHQIVDIDELLQQFIAPKEI